MKIFFSAYFIGFFHAFIFTPDVVNKLHSIKFRHFASYFVYHFSRLHGTHGQSRGKVFKSVFISFLSNLTKPLGKTFFATLAPFRFIFQSPDKFQPFLMLIFAYYQRHAVFGTIPFHLRQAQFIFFRGENIGIVKIYGNFKSAIF